MRLICYFENGPESSVTEVETDLAIKDLKQRIAAANRDTPADG